MESTKDNTSTSKLLYDEPALLVFPSLATRIGLNEAILVQQLHYWMVNPKIGKVIEGKHWIFNTIEQWQENFPFWSRNTIRRVLDKLEQKKIIKSGNHNKLTLDHTKWYTLDYGALAEYQRPKKKGKLVNFGKSSAQVRQKDLPKFGNAIPETTTETTTNTLQAAENTAPAVSALDAELDAPIQSKALAKAMEAKATANLSKEAEPADLTDYLKEKALEAPSKVPLKVSPPTVTPARKPPKPKPEKKPSIVQPVNDMIARHIQGIDPKMAVGLTGTLSQKAAGVWRRHLDKEKLTADDYAAVARSIQPFVAWYSKECEGCSLPTSPPTFENRYAQFVSTTLNGKPKQAADDYIRIPHPGHPPGSNIFKSVLRTSKEGIAYANRERD
jgi:hypothetical protein